MNGPAAIVVSEKPSEIPCIVCYRQQDHYPRGGGGPATLSRGLGNNATITQTHPWLVIRDRERGKRR